MSYLRRDLFVDATGRLHTVTADGSSLRFDDGGVVAAPGVFYTRIVIDGQGVVWTIYSGEVGGVTLLRNGVQVHHYPGDFGFGWSVLRPYLYTVEVYLQGPHKGDGTCTVGVYNPNGMAVRVYNHVEYSANGMIDIAPDGTPISANRPPIVIDGVTFWNWTQRDGYTAGVSDCGDSQFGGVVLRKPDGTMVMAQLDQHIQVPVRLSGGFVAASGIDTPEPTAMPWEPYRQYETPPVPPQPDCAECEAQADLGQQAKDLCDQDRATLAVRNANLLSRQLTAALDRLRECRVGYDHALTELARVQGRIDALPWYLKPVVRRALGVYDA
jgi:hypothetical protein